MAFTFVQENNSSGLLKSAPWSVKYSSAVSAGNLLWALAAHGSLPSQISTVSDSQGNTWVQVQRVVSSLRACDLWYARAEVSGTNTVTIGSTSAPTMVGQIAEVSGFAQAISVHALSSGAVSNSTTVHSLASLTTDLPTAYLLGVCQVENGFTATANSSFTGRAPNGGGFYTEDQSASSTKTTNGTFTTAASPALAVGFLVAFVSATVNNAGGQTWQVASCGSVGIGV